MTTKQNDIPNLRTNIRTANTFFCFFQVWNVFSFSPAIPKRDSLLLSVPARAVVPEGFVKHVVPRHDVDMIVVRPAQHQTQHEQEVAHVAQCRRAIVVRLPHDHLQVFQFLPIGQK